MKKRRRVGNRGGLLLRIAVAAVVVLAPMTVATASAQTTLGGDETLHGTPENPAVGPSPLGELATRVTDVAVETGAGSTVIRVQGDGEFSFATFRLSDPERFVVDLEGVVNGFETGYLPVSDSSVDQIRVAQFRGDPEPVTRVVIDLDATAIPAIERTGDELILTFAGSDPLPVTIVADEPSEAMPETELELEEHPFGSEFPAPAEEPVAEPTVEPEAEIAELAPEPIVEPEPEAFEPTVEAAEPAIEPEEEVAAQAVEEQPFEAAAADELVEPVVEELVEPKTWDFTSTAAAADETVEVAAIEVAAPEVEVAAAPQPEFETTSEVELYESVQVTMESPASDQTEIVEEPASFESRTVGGGGRVYRGEPMDLSLKDADIKDVLRSFAQISGLNVVVQPGVSGKVTVELTQVPWDQALEQILKINGLGYELEGNIMRVATNSVLRQEAEENQRLLAAKALSVPLHTVMKRISYGDPQDIARVLQNSVMSQRGSAIVDRRTNTLIIKELPGFMDTVLAVIENLDTPEPQVMIEARIVETTKRFERSLGIEWNFLGVSSAATGNTTGLQFPNNGSVEGGVNLLTGANNGFLSLSLGNVLNTFNLDATLNAAENEGLINILSAPKVATLNNEQASIQSGLQIPIQTIANNTVSVQFVNATLRLDVTPHVTAEGTVLMEINIQKREPQLAFAVVGATNAPISTKEARTRVIVRDGGTTVIGGIYEVSTDQGSDRVPGLADIPILGGLFKNKRRTDENEELLIFITPRVIKL